MGLKITYDSKGLVVSGTAATTADIDDAEIFQEEDQIVRYLESFNEASVRSYKGEVITLSYCYCFK